MPLEGNLIKLLEITLLDIKIAPASILRQ